MVRFYNFVFFFSILFFHCTAQVDTEFWFAPPEITYGHGDLPIILRVSSQAGRRHGKCFSTRKGIIWSWQTLQFPLTQRGTLTSPIIAIILETIIPNTVMNTGLHIVSSAPITAYYEEASFFNAEIFVLKGKKCDWETNSFLLHKIFLITAWSIFR